jgi:hypothetical protein
MPQFSYCFLVFSFNIKPSEQDILQRPWILFIPIWFHAKVIENLHSRLYYWSLLIIQHYFQVSAIKLFLDI